jgi:hypothetical protein
MFVRFRQARDRLQVSLLETRRVAGKVRHEHVAGLGAIELEMTVEARLAFWRKVEDRLVKLANRIGDNVGRIRGELFARIPMPSIDEQRAVQLANAKADAELAGKLHDMHDASVADHERFVALAQQKTATHPPPWPKPVPNSTPPASGSLRSSAARFPVASASRRT